MKDFWLRLRALLFRKRADRELDEEIGFHLEMETRKNVAAGMTPSDAARAAQVQFGTASETVKDYCRDVRGVGVIETFLSDVRYALRGFRRTPLFALTVIGTIAIGLGWNTAAFTVFNAYLLRPIDAKDPYSLYAFGWDDRAGAPVPITWSQLDDLRQALPGMAAISAMHPMRTRMEGRFAGCVLVDGEFFRMLGVSAVLGRTLAPEDVTAPGGAPAAVLSYRAWQNRFDARPDIIGRRISVQGQPFTVVGVMPEEFTGVGHSLPELWLPLSVLGQFAELPRGNGPGAPAPVSLVGRIESGESVVIARTALTVWMQRLAPEKAPQASLFSVATMTPMARSFAPLLPIGIAFFLVLVSACANVANMMLARAMSRQREIGIRLSIGASRARLVRQLLVESILLAIPAAGAGYAVSMGLLEAGKRLILATIPPMVADQARVAPIETDARVLWFMLGASVLVALLFGLAPSLQATRLNVMQAARGDFSSEFRPNRLRNALVIAQVTVCSFLLIGCAVLLRGANHLEKLDPGIRTRDIVEIEVPEQWRAQAIERLRSSPVVESLAASAAPPIDATLPEVTASGAPGGALNRMPFQAASPEYFTTLEIPILRGRNFNASEAHTGAPVVILSESAARRLWPGANPIGQAIQLAAVPGSLALPRTLQVVGVARDTVAGTIDRTDRSCLFLPTAVDSPHNVLLVRVAGAPRLAISALSAQIDDRESGIHLVQDFLDAGVWAYRLAYWVSAGLGLIALLLTLSGIYGVLAYVVAQRTKEIGIRMALGAGAVTVIGLVLQQCGKLAGIGIVLGAIMAAAAAAFYSALIADGGIDPRDQVAYLGGITVVIAACLAAAYFPARRAASVDPITTLRYD